MFERLGQLTPQTQRVVLIVGCILLYCVWCVRVPLTEIDETRYTEATREMQASGDYIIPYFNYVPRYQKPILYYWVQSVSVRALGSNEFAARLPSGILAIALVLLLHAFLLRWLTYRAPAEDERARIRARGSAMAGALALATVPLFAVWARSATTDMTLTFFTTMAMLCLLQADLAHAIEGRPRAVRGWYLLAALLIGLAFLTKGPVGLAIPGIAWLVYHFSQKNLAQEARRVPWGWALLAFAVVALPWYAATYPRVGYDFLAHFFLVENVERFSSKAMEGHGGRNPLQVLGIYAAFLVILVYPYLPFVLREWVTPFAGSATARTDVLLCRVRRFATVWFAVVIGIFLFSKTQLPSYIQAISAAVAILFALHVYGYLTRETSAEPANRANRSGRVIAIVWLLFSSILFVGAPLAILWMGGIAGPLGTSPIPRVPAMISFVALALVGAALFYGLVRRACAGQWLPLMAGVTTGWTLVLVVLILGPIPLTIISGYQPSVEIGHVLRAQPGRDKVFTCSKETSEDLIYYAERQVAFFHPGGADFASALRQQMAASGSALVVVDEKGWDEVRQLGHVEELHTRGTIRVVRVTPAVPPSQPAPVTDSREAGRQ